MDPIPVLSELGIKIKQIPQVVNCPQCKEVQFSVNHDPSGGTWCFCSSCGLAGDPVEILAACSHISLPDAITQVKTITSSQGLTDDVVRDYDILTHTRNKVKTALEEWSSRRSVRRMNHNMLTAYRLHDSIGQNWDISLGRILGFTTKSEYIERTGFNVPQFHPPGPDNCNVLVSPGQPIHGKVGCIAFFTPDAGRRRASIRKLQYGGTTDALFFLQTIRQTEDTVFATAELADAVLMFAHGAVIEPNLAPLIGYTEDTNTAWASINPRKVVFIDRPSDSVLIAARKVADVAYISMGEHVEDGDLLKYMSGHSLKECLREREISAIPFHHAVRDTLSSRETGMGQLLAGQLDLTEDDKNKILSYAQSDDEKKRLANIMAGSIVSRSIPIGNGRTLIQRSDCWVISQGKAQEYVACNAIPIIENITTFEGEARYVGHIRAGGKIAEFSVNEKDFTADWLSQFCMNTMQEWVTIHNDLKRNFMHFVREMQPAKARIDKGLDSVGWDHSTRAFEFPRTVIMSSGRFEQQTRDCVKNPPAATLTPPKAIPGSYVETWLTSNSAEFWACAAACVGLMLSHPENVATYAAGVYHPDPDVRRAYMELVSSLCHTEPIELRDAKEVARIEAAHRYPAIVSPYDREQFGVWAIDKNDRNCICFVDSEMYRTAVLTPGWCVVDISRAETAPDIAGIKSIVPSVLAYYQKCKVDLCDTFKGRRHIIYAALRLVESWMTNSFNVAAGGGRMRQVNEARQCLVVDHSLAKRFLYSVLFLLEAGAVTRGNSNEVVTQPKEAVVTCRDCVIVASKRVYRALKVARLPRPVMADITASLKSEAGDKVQELFNANEFCGWSVPRTYWETVTAQWNCLRA